jgi:hypothetical protein
MIYVCIKLAIIRIHVYFISLQRKPNLPSIDETFNLSVVTSTPAPSTSKAGTQGPVEESTPLKQRQGQGQGQGHEQTGPPAIPPRPIAPAINLQSEGEKEEDQPENPDSSFGSSYY